jgi:hypothetical protein
VPYLAFIQDSRIEFLVSDLLEKARKSQRESVIAFERNVIDPFAALFEMASFNISTVADWRVQEARRQAQKTLQNALGEFHQQVLGSVSGWSDTGRGGIVDLVCEEKKLIAEVKNKYNTVKGSDRIKYYQKFEEMVQHRTSRYHGWACYFVEVVPAREKQYDKPFIPPDNTTGVRAPENKSIRLIDGRSFYRLVTGRPQALDELIDALPRVLEKISSYRFAAQEVRYVRDYFDKAY